VQGAALLRRLILWGLQNAAPFVLTEVMMPFVGGKLSGVMLGE
jgi:hypothetical protein